MKPLHQEKFERAFARLYQKYTLECGIAPEAAREMAADDAWTECAEQEAAITRLGLELNAIAAALGIGGKRSDG